MIFIEISSFSYIRNNNKKKIYNNLIKQNFEEILNKLFMKIIDFELYYF